MKSKIKIFNYIISKLEGGSTLSLKDIKKIIESEFDDTPSDRTIQRYKKELIEEYSQIEEKTYAGERRIFIPSNLRLGISSLPIKPNENNILAMHLLKSHLTHFKNTKIEEDTEKLINKLEEFTKEEIFAGESLFWDQNYGKYKYDEINNGSKIIDEIISLISKEKLVSITYQGQEKEKTFDAVFRQFFNYAGSLYVACYIPHHNQHIALAVQFISKIKEKEGNIGKIPKFDYKEFTKDRFGVHHGDLEKVLLEVDGNYERYFKNRQFHQSQRTFEDNGNIIISMDVPLSPELISWIMSWGGAIKVRKPDTLKNMVIAKANNIIDKNS